MGYNEAYGYHKPIVSSIPDRNDGEQQKDNVYMTENVRVRVTLDIDLNVEANGYENQQGLFEAYDFKEDVNAAVKAFFKDSPGSNPEVFDYEIIK